MTVTSGSATVSGNALTTGTGNATINVTTKAKPTFTFTFGSDVSSVKVDGTTISSSGGTVKLNSSTRYTVTVTVSDSSNYEFDAMTVTSGSATVNGDALTTGTGNATINVRTRPKPVYTFTFGSNVSSITINGATISSSGGTVQLDGNTNYRVTVNDEDYEVNTMTVTSGSATVSGNTLTTGTGNATINVTGKLAQDVNVTFTYGSGEVRTITIYYNGVQVSNPLKSGKKYYVSVTGGNNGEGDYAYNYASVSSGTGYSVVDESSGFDLYTGSDDGTIAIHMRYTGCITESTLVTLANGTKVPVKELQGDEELLVWDFETGSYSTAPIVFIEPEEERDYDIIHLYFDDGTDIETMFEHGFYDYTLNKYIYINDDNPEQYIGHEFVKQDGNTYETVELVRVEHEVKRTRVYGLTTFKHFNFFNNDMLSIEGNITGMFNYFEVDRNTMSYDQARKQADIEQYGLLTYEELVEHIGEGIISELGFEAYNGQYLKVSVGKGLITWDGIKALAERYGHFTE